MVRTADGFVRLYVAPGQSLPSETPVLFRGVLYDPKEWGLVAVARPELAFVDPETAALTTYPATVLYGGPTTKGVLDSPMGQAWARSMNGYFHMHYQKFLAHEFVPIAPSGWPVGATPVWPHTGWRWWWARETQKQPTYRLAQKTPTFADWVQV